jgi:Domain of unknown function DUF11
MRIASRHRGTTTFTAVLALVLGLLSFSASAQAGGGITRQGTGPTPLVLPPIDVPPTADLGVSLLATAGGLASRQVVYDVAVHNNGRNTASSATITTQLSSAVSAVDSATCTINFATDRVSCPIGSVANGATTHATFTATYSLLSLDALPATATRTTSAPFDINAANDSDSAACTALTALLITC